MAYKFPPKQDLLLSGANIKTLSGVSLLGSGDANAIHDAGSNPATIDFAYGATQKLIVNGAGPLVLSFSNPTSGGFYVLRIEQGATTGSITWPDSVNWGTIGEPTLSNATDEVDLISLFYDGSQYWGVAQIQDALPAANNALTNLSFSSSGTVGQVLTLQSGGPAWAAAAGGASFPLFGSLGAANAPTYSFLGDDDTGMWSSGANNLNFSTAGTEHVRITDSGNVGIGTTSPAFKLDIRASGTSFPNSGFGFEPVIQSICGAGGSGGHLALRAEAVGSGTPSTVGGGVIFLGGSSRHDPYVDSILFITDKLHRMFINKAGNIGIGTETPSQKLEVNGNIYVNKEGSYIAVDENGQARLGLMKFSGTGPQIVGQNGIVFSTCPDHFSNNLGGVKTIRLIITGGGDVQVPNYILSPKHFNAGTKTENFTLDLANGPCQEVIINAAGPLTVTLTNPVTGGSYLLKIKQGATTGALAWPGSIKWGSAGEPTLSTVTDKIDIINLYFDGADYFATYALGY